MKLSVQKRLGASVFGCSPSKVKFAPDRLTDIKEAITKADIRSLINDGVIVREQDVGVSRARAKHKANQRKKGLQRGPGKRKGKATALVPRKQAWMVKIRVQRQFITELRDSGIVDAAGYKNLYRKAKGGFFRSKRHIKIYMNEHGIVQDKTE